ncbi:putative UDP-Xyl: (mannosyl) glucuronoxylomannan/galactoxylomannan beta-1,2-xylosyltransferase [Penicillium oxalicum 114-2]|uniref:Putative UDP-Xyl: (Mannosyl) glucuronoxylomannan/galactoxylomannan beta-1,2-xylosyltransferase n=1 Tax=Penicillium oxalicum (strain 114-2 / CGMCC 5302) TaxID=933388 RepID=S8AKK6_PENO1|nr:putative UDP-Xyl: (mannosyl) glucuronoxylomannan/galactoxylomannan beta-1,2-xylosyltransferase [Penicillium oxalicum 114-2]
MSYVTLGLLGILSLCLISGALHAVAAWTLTAFVLARCASFLLLHTCRENVEQSSLLEIADAVVFRVSTILVVVFLVRPSSTTLVWQMGVQALCNSAEIAATLYLILSGLTLTALTIRSYSATAIEALQWCTSSEGFVLSSVSALSLKIGIDHISQPSTHRRLFSLMLLPFFALLSVNPGFCNVILSLSNSNFWQGESAKLQVRLDPSIHPIHHLATKAENDFNATIRRQSQTLAACCIEYERRYGRKPPLHFDKWFYAAQKQGFVLMDEFDTMMSAMEPLWGVAPADIRARVESIHAVSKDDEVYMFKVRQGDKPLFINPRYWMSFTFNSWFDSEVLQTLPNMTIAMNTMDEPKVVVPHDRLSHALHVAQPPHREPVPPSQRPNMAQHVDVLDIGRQETWDTLSLSCAPATAARDLSVFSSRSPFLTEMGFISNITLSKDVCQFPELHKIHAGLRHPSTMTITHSLVPVFPQTKPSCFNDLLYPSPFFAEKLRLGEYKEDQDVDWEQKENIERRLTAENSVWVEFESSIAAITNFTRVRISAVIQCDLPACREQEQELHIKEGQRDDISDGYKARYNLDLDGNGLSGRFYRLLMSKSAVLKQTLYQEWHDDSLIPWFRYIPISMDLRDFPEIVRYLTQEPDGRALGARIAKNSFDWSRRVLRSEDMRLVWWRLMLEYGRLVNDDRDKMSFNT